MVFSSIISVYVKLYVREVAVPILQRVHFYCFPAFLAVQLHHLDLKVFHFSLFFSSDQYISVHCVIADTGA